MKRNYLYILIAVATLGFLLSCQDTPKDEAKESKQIITENPVNDFIWKGLNSWYYWQGEVPNLSDKVTMNVKEYNRLISGRDPQELFTSLLYRQGEVDRFSWIQDLDELKASFSGISKSSGMDLLLTRMSETQIVGLVNYVIPNSPAQNAGIKRGNVIVGINGKAITVNNYHELFGDHLEISYVEHLLVENNKAVIPTLVKKANLNAEVLSENPLAYLGFLSQGNKKVAYLVYNGFNANYNDELNRIFLEIKKENITDLILDLRYNGGGSVGSAIALAQMITGNFTGQPYVKVKHNAKHKKEDAVFSLSTLMPKFDYQNGDLKYVGTENINSIFLKKIYILTSRGTASASELTITGLKPYIKVVTIGGETYGKFVGSNTLYDSPAGDYVDAPKRNKRHNWAMQPITFAYYNAIETPHPSNGKGITPDYRIALSQYFLGLGEFGDVQTDPALAKAFELIFGNTARKAFPRVNIPTEFIGTTKTLKPLGTELYLDEKDTEFLR